MLTDFRLEIFMAVARTGSFTAAAKSMSITQPAVSHSISVLEQEIGETLFVRSRANVSLTPTGVRFEVYARKILRLYGAIQTVLVEKTSEEPEPVRFRLSNGRTVSFTAEDDEIRLKLL